MPTDPTTTKALDAFRGSYGRLCSLSAARLHEGDNPATVTGAALGQGDAPEHDKIRTARIAMDLACVYAHAAGNSYDTLLRAGVEAKEAVEGEWHLVLSMKETA